MAYAPVNGNQVYYEVRGSGRPLVLLHGGVVTIDLTFGPLLEPLAASRQVIAPEPERFAESAAMTSALVHEFPGWTAEQLKSPRAPVLLVFGDRDFWPLTDVAELFAMLPDARLAVLPGATHMDLTRRPGEMLALITPFLDGS